MFWSQLDMYYPVNYHINARLTDCKKEWIFSEVTQGYIHTLVFTSILNRWPSFNKMALYLKDFYFLLSSSRAVIRDLNSASLLMTSLCMPAIKNHIIHMAILATYT